jgi:rod shape determining protein RodA
MIDRRLITHFDWGLLTLVLLIAGLGVVNIASATASYHITGTPYYVKQMYWICAGILLVITICSIDYHLLEDFAYWFYGILMIMLLAVLFAGKSSMGATRWLSLGFMSFQPSEPMKIIIIMAYARYFTTTPHLNGLGFKDLFYPFLLVMGPVLFIMKQPDLGTATLVFLVAASMLMFVGIRLTTLISIAMATIPAFFLGWHFYLRDYQKERLLNFFSPERDPLGSGYHIIQSKIAVGSGGFLGKGFMQGTQTQLHFLPEQHTDFAFSVFSEEWGFAGCLVVLLLYLCLIYWGLSVAKKCNDSFGKLVAVGVTAMLFWHIVINIGMVIGLFPVVGVPLPLFSYGGTSMVTSMVGIAILLNIQMRKFMF